MRGLVLLITVFIVFLVNPLWAGCLWQEEIVGGELHESIHGPRPDNLFAVGYGGQIVHYDGVTWGTMASPVSSWLFDVWASESEAYAVGFEGKILHYDGAGWSIMIHPYESPVTNLESVWGFTDSVYDIYIAGYQPGVGCLILKYDGAAWSLVDTGFRTDTVWDIWGTSASDIFATTLTGILHYNGASWSFFTIGSEYLYSVWGLSPSDVFAIGNNFYYYDGKDWTKESLISKYATAIWGTNQENLYVTTHSGEIWHYNHLTKDWTLAYANAGYSSLESILGFAPLNIYAVGYLGLVVKCGAPVMPVGGKLFGALLVIALAVLLRTRKKLVWLFIPFLFLAMPFSAALAQCRWQASYFGAEPYEKISGSSADNIFAVGYNGQISHYDGHSWNAMTSKSTTYLQDVWCDDKEAYAVGDHGTILHYNGTAWSSMANPFASSATTYNAVWGFTEGAYEVFAGGVYTGMGVDCLILRYAGTTWSLVSVPITTYVPVNSFWGFTEDSVPAKHHLFASTAEGMLHYDGTTWTLDSATYGNYLYRLWGLSLTDIYGVGTSFFHYDGSSWSSLADAPRYLSSVWGTAPDDLRAADTDCQIWHYEGVTWSVEYAGPSYLSLWTIWGTAPDSIWTGGSDGLLVHYQCIVPLQGIFLILLAALFVPAVLIIYRKS